MNILITNDDGIHARGLEALSAVFGKKHSVYVIAPDREQSACSNAITVRSVIHVKRLAEGRYQASGFPADCVSIGLNGTLLPAIDLVLSGINHGPNVGEDLFFSGTTAAARTAYIFGKHGFAVSIDSTEPEDSLLRDAAEFMLQFIGRIQPLSEPAPLFYNINYPHLPSSEIKGVKFTFTGKRIYRDKFISTELNMHEMVLELKGGIGSHPVHGSDASELDSGFISITPLTTECTDFVTLEKIGPAILDWRQWA